MAVILYKFLYLLRINTCTEACIHFPTQGETNSNTKPDGSRNTWCCCGTW